jgi:hypothetical protein
MMEMDRWEMNDAFLGLAVISLCVALVILVILVCIAKCRCRRVIRRGGKKRSAGER